MSEHRQTPRGPMGRGHMSTERAKDFKGALLKLLRHMGAHRAALIFVAIFAVGSTIFNVIGPKVLSKATTELFNGLVAKVQGTGGIDFAFIGRILLMLLGLYLVSALFSFLQGWLMSGVTQKVCYGLRRDISEKSTACP